MTEPGAVRYAVWEQPRPLGGPVTGPEDERHPTYSPDGRSIVFCVGRRGLGADLWIADLIDGAAVDPRPLAVANSPADEWAPCFGADALWFASDRPGGSGGLDLYRATWREGLLGPVERVAGGLCSAADDTDPAPRSLKSFPAATTGTTPA